ncbi:alpha/beta fold hydrolase [Corynebacterium sp. HS2168-gen11]|uniref:alpha/beta fold hydrolase n=1 Tax=Corynebacterium sp. HS2168-gen11 TaxID=2974027 RepID=UPI00216AB4D8|nr:alpha/beta fold hydrolase [Corynebacterium sp. HS2168-gen11]MCS4535385.1 alpha/beta fold hydrolase [Corynebacterium sp. HS2168-gen11]
MHAESENPEVFTAGFHVIGTSDGSVDFFDEIRYTTVDLLDGTQTPLHLSVTRPHGAKEFDDLPVVVFIHGGSYVSGSYHDPDFQTFALARANVITVSVEYRLGLDGFVQFHNEPASSYRGVTDCLTALQWVQNHIEAFGGDPTNVTLTGQSAGGGIVLWLMRKDHYSGLFRRAFAMSPAFPAKGFPARKKFLRFALGTPITKPALRALSRQQLDRGYSRMNAMIPFDLTLGPYPYDPAELADIPLAISTTREEMHHIARPKLPRLFLRYAFGITKHWQPAMPENQVGSAISDSKIRQHAYRTASMRPQTFLLEHRGHSPILHCEDMPWIAGNTADQAHVFELFLDFVRGNYWQSYGEHKQVLINTTTELTYHAGAFDHFKNALKPH